MKHNRSLSPEIKAALAVLLQWLVGDEQALSVTSTRIELIDQRQSALGRRRHAAVVRRRLANGQNGASIVGRNFYLTAEAHQEELSAISLLHVAPQPEVVAPVSIAHKLHAALAKGGAP